MSYAMRDVWSTEGSSALARSGEVRFKVLEGGLSRSLRADEAWHEDAVQVRRNGIVAFVCVTAIILALGITALGMSLSVEARVADSVASLPYETVTVQAGDSLWSIASGCEVPGYGTADVVRWIRERNHLDSANLHPGQSLEVPVAS